MSPVSFECVGDGSDRAAMMAQARALAEAGIRIHSIDEERGLLVRSEDAVRARRVLAGDDDRVARVEPLDRPPDVTIDLPGSKSHTNRALLCAALAPGHSTLTRVLLADDTEAMLGAVAALGAGVEVDRAHSTVTVDGRDGGAAAAPAGEPVTIGVRQSGTTGRFLLPVLAATPGRWVLDGHAQLRSRPFGPQIEALRRLGAEVDGEVLPLTIAGRTLAGGAVEVSASLSSQFLSGLLLAAPLHTGPTTFTVAGPMVSQPYVELTIAAMADFGVEVGRGSTAAGAATWTVAGDRYRPATIDLEPDASAASYFFAAAAITGGRVRIEGLGSRTVQGDLRFVELLGRMGAEVDIGPDATEVRGTGTLHGIEADLADLSDTAQTLAVVAAFADGPTTIDGIGFIRHKETDRIQAPVTELRRLGIDADATDDGMVIRPGPVRPARIRTYDDHRMAMSFALFGLVNPGIEIEDPGCVAKTFPDYFEVLDRLR